MPTYISPAGNPEVWDNKPNGYMTESEWQVAQPAPPAPTLEEALTQKLSEVMRAYTAAFDSVEAIYPAAEREGWTTQEAEAAAVLANPSASTPVLSILVNLRAKGETIAQLAQKVLDNAANWRVLYAYLTGQQQRMYAEVTALASGAGVTAAHILAYEVTYLMPEGM